MCLRPRSSLRRKTSTIWDESAFSSGMDKRASAVGQNRYPDGLETPLLIYPEQRKYPKPVTPLQYLAGLTDEGGPPS